MATYLVIFLTFLSAIPLIIHGEQTVHHALDLRNYGIPVVIPAVDYSINKFLQSVLSSNISTKSELALLNEGLKDLDGSSTDCFADISYILGYLSLPSTIQFRYIDAAAKIPPGIMQGKFSWVGDYQECYSIPKLINPNTTTPFKGNYFTGVLTLNGKGLIANYPVSAGMCLPDSCDALSATEFLNYILSELKTKYSFIPKDLTVLMIKDEAKQWSHGAIGMTVVCGILVAMVTIGTIVDILKTKLDSHTQPKVILNESYDESPSDRSGLLADEIFADGIQLQQPWKVNAKQVMLDVVLAFSFLRNSSKLFNTETAVGPLACLNGVRVLSMWWVILGHTYAFCIYAIDNPLEALKIEKRLSFQPIMNGTFSVDSFFFLSGLLVAYLAMKEFLEKERFNWIYYYIHRYWRLTPLYAFVLFFYAYLLVHLFQGPFRTTLDPGFEKNCDTCKEFWWTNLIYINNFYPYHGSLAGTCLGWSWYLANDMQFYLFVSPVVLVLFMYARKHLLPSRNKLPGIAGAMFFIVACIIVRGSLVSYYGIYGLQGPPTKHKDEPMGKNGALYGRPYARMSVYVVGMLTGLVLAEYKNRIRIPKIVALIGWCVSIATALAVIYGQYYYFHHANPLDPTHQAHMTLTTSIFYVSLSRTLWGACLAWMVLACVSGNGGWVTQILSWKIWAPLGRLTYAAYLIHPIVIFGYYLNLLQPLHFSDWVMVNIFLSNLVITYALSFIVSMFMEAPMLQLEKAILKQRQPRL